MLPVVFTWVPAVVAVIAMPVVVHDAPAASVPPVNEMVLGAVRVSVPPHSMLDPLVTVRPEGSVSVNVIPL